MGKGEDTSELVRGMGWVPFIFHTVELVPLEGKKIRKELLSFLNQGPIEWMVLMSSTGVNLLFDNVSSEADVYEPLRRASFLAVGPRTKDTLMRYGVRKVSVPRKYSSSGVYEFFSQKNLENLRVVLVRSSSADDSLAESLLKRGAIVSTVNIYDSKIPTDLETTLEFLNGLSEGRFHAVLFTSAISVSNLFEIARVRLSLTTLVELLRRTRIGAIGPATAEELRRRGVESIVPDEYLIENALKKLLSKPAVDQKQLVS